MKRSDSAGLLTAERVLHRPRPAWLGGALLMLVALAACSGEGTLPGEAGGATGSGGHGGTTKANSSGGAPPSRSSAGASVASSSFSTSSLSSSSSGKANSSSSSSSGSSGNASSSSTSSGNASSSSSSSSSSSGNPRTSQANKQAWVDLRFGMFIHFGILTYTGSWAQANLDITKFNPTKLDAAQWAAAAKSAGMKFGVLTTRHHDGFGLWPSKADKFNVGHIPWRNGGGDVVKEYVDAFRAAGLQPAFYYSVWNTTNPENTAYVKAQLTELLGGTYGKIPMIVFDGWAWMRGHKAIAYQEIHDLVKSLQPDILMTDHHGILSPWDEDLVMFEEPRGSFAPVANTYAAVQGNKINGSGGNDWFWKSNIGGLRSVSYVVTDHLKKLEPRYTNFILDCPPNSSGLLDQAIVDALASYGKAWAPDTSRAPLPDQGIQNDFPYTPSSATATSGTASAAIDGVDDLINFSVWQSSTSLPQSITIDLGKVLPDVGLLGYLPPYSSTTKTWVQAGTITGYLVSVSTDNSTFTQVATGTWPVTHNLKYVTWAPRAARYVRLTATAANGGFAGATEIVLGARR